MSQQSFYVPKIRPQFQKVGGEEMPQGMQNAFLCIPEDFSARAKYYASSSPNIDRLPRLQIDTL